VCVCVCIYIQRKKKKVLQVWNDMFPFDVKMRTNYSVFDMKIILEIMKTSS